MNTADTQYPDDAQNPADPTRPFDFWITAVDRLMGAEFASAFEGAHASRRDWRLLHIVDGTASARRPLTAHKLRDLVDRGWVVADGDGFMLTDEGRDAKSRLGDSIDDIRATATDAVSPDDLATTIASLERIARAFGWDEESPLPRGRGRRHGRGGRHGRDFGRGFGGGHGFGRGHGHGHARGFGPESGIDPRHGHAHGFGPGFGPRHGGGVGHGPEFGPHREHGADAVHGARSASGDHGCAHRAARVAQSAYERGFDAGFSRGRDA